MNGAVMQGATTCRGRGPHHAGKDRVGTWETALIDDLASVRSTVEQDGRRARLHTAPGATIDPICRAIGVTLPPVSQEMPSAP
jgi:hypothetical protein